LSANDEGRCACGRAGHAAREEKRRTGDGGERTGVAILRTLATGDALVHVIVAQTRGRTHEGEREASADERPRYGRQRELMLHEASELLSDSQDQQGETHAPSVDLIMTCAGAALRTVDGGKSKGACGAGASKVVTTCAFLPLLGSFLSACVFPLFPAPRLLPLSCAWLPLRIRHHALFCSHLFIHSPRVERFGRRRLPAPRVPNARRAIMIGGSWAAHSLT
jgi:hypothetical protein